MAERKPLYYEDVNEGDEVPAFVVENLTRTDLVKYAGASGDFSVAYGGYSNGDNSDAIIQTSGLFTDEFIAAL